MSYQQQNHCLRTDSCLCKGHVDKSGVFTTLKGPVDIVTLLEVLYQPIHNHVKFTLIGRTRQLSKHLTLGK